MPTRNGETRFIILSIGRNPFKYTSSGELNNMQEFFWTEATNSCRLRIMVGVLSSHVGSSNRNRIVKEVFIITSGHAAGGY
jgi:hypothetical protein